MNVLETYSNTGSRAADRVPRIIRFTCLILLWFPASLALSSDAAGSSEADSNNAGSGSTVAGMTISDCQQGLQSEHRVERLRAARTLGAFNEDAAVVLIEALAHDDPAVRFLAATNLGRIGGDPLRDATDKLKQLANAKRSSDDDESAQPLSVQLAAAYALCEAGKTKRYLPALTAAVTYPERGTACYAADLIGRLGPDAAAAEDVLQDAYEKNRPGVKGGDYHIGGAAMNALRKIRGE